MDTAVKNKLAKLHELFQRGSTDGEKQATKAALDRILKKYDLENINFDDLSKKDYRFKYTSRLEQQLLNRLRLILLDLEECKIYATNHNHTGGKFLAVKEVVITLDELDYITLEAAYEYFRRHMKAEWVRVAMPVLDRCRKAKTRNKKRKQLQAEFFQAYIIASHLYKEDELKPRTFKSDSEYKAARLFNSVEGGQYTRQMNNGLYLSDKNE